MKQTRSISEFTCCPKLPDFTLVQIQNIPKFDWKDWPRGYKTFFMLKSAENEIDPAHKC